MNSKNYHLIIKDKEDRQMNKLSDTFELKNGVSIPCIGYGNEISVGKGIAESGIAIRGTPWQIYINPAKSVTPYRIVENANVFDFTLSDADMERINRLDNFGDSGLHPDKVDF